MVACNRVCGVLARDEAHDVACSGNRVAAHDAYDDNHARAHDGAHDVACGDSRAVVHGDTLEACSHTFLHDVSPPVLPIRLEVTWRQPKHTATPKLPNDINK